MWECMKRSGDFNVKLTRRKTGYGTFSAEMKRGFMNRMMMKCVFCIVLV